MRIKHEDPAVQAAIAAQQSPTGPAQGAPMAGGLPGSPMGEAPDADDAPMGPSPTPTPPPAAPPQTAMPAKKSKKTPPTAY